MGVLEQDRQAHDSTTQTNLPHHDEPDDGTVRQSASRGGKSDAISPPPLKRQRVEGHSRGVQPSACKYLERRASTASSVSKHSVDGQTSRLSLSHKPACRICSKTTVTSYNPIIVCAGCSKFYHDSCRKPPLSPDVKSTYKNHNLDAAMAISRHSIVRDIFKPRSGYNLPAAILPISPNRPGKSHETPRQRGPKLIEHVEIPNTLTQPLSVVISLGPSPKKFHDAQTQVEATLDVQFQSQEPNPSRVLCSICRKMHVPTGSAIKSTQCQSCHEKLPIVKVEIPETPAGTAFYDTPPRSRSMSAENSVASTKDVTTIPESENAKHMDTLPDRVSLQLPCVNIQPEEALVTLPDTPNSIRVGARTESLSAKFGFINTNDKHTPTQQSEANNVNKEVEQEGANKLGVEVSHRDTLPPTDTQSCTELDAEKTALVMPKTFPTHPELAIIALVAANGSAMTFVQIIDWLVQHFYYLRKGQGTWEKSLKAVLSNRPEFHSSEDILGHERMKLYSFASPTYKARFEKEYRHYLGSYLPRKLRQAGLQPEARSSVMAIPKGSRRKAIKSAPSRRNFVPPSRMRPPNQDEDNDPSLDPVALQVDMLSKSPEPERETSFYRVQTDCIKQSIERMTLEEKARKIVEIQSRPSRKRIFGPDHRLAHVLREQRQDIHDESGGAWKPNFTSMKEKQTRRGERSLLEAFDLPENAIPMNDGQELAFRDGTLLNGRLQRPRQIYRVGKVFGSELTTRHS
ncbi:hypothetical protein GMOD_00005132 [Pyrenophora seminiperda CCB06]|uniref:PHD-type domain-containing protein n=1 Tax=Pyrenophora seminiperda CCB06 TaxID=1302712 RepID=A0A3M7LV17_9PLEO|nr:hypothetical protein GMOD_00005132 [Pyrenophora seminiperda CCB06]